MSGGDLQKDRFSIGGEDLLPQPVPAPDGEAGDDGRKHDELLDDIRVRVGTLLKTETVSLLLGAGSSVDCGGQLIGRVPIALERDLLDGGITGSASPRVRRWLRVFYLAVRNAGNAGDVPLNRDAVVERRQRLKALSEIGEDEERKGQESKAELQVNYERVLATLHRWRAALSETGGRLRVDGSPVLDARAEDLDAALQQATRALARACVLPVAGKEASHTTFRTLVRKLLTRPLNLKRVNVFTLNYDTLVEQAADAGGVVLLDGFVGTQRRVFRPECYEQDLYFPAETTEGRVHRFDRVLHLYKLHGSITWRASEPTIDDPYGVQSVPFESEVARPVLIYPTPAKFGETLGLPYSELFRRFAAALARPQSVLFVIGYGFGDEHVNAIIRQALAVPSFTLVIVDPAPTSAFVRALREQGDRRIWIAEGPSIGTLSGFVKHLFPDLRDEEVRKKILETHRALAQLDPARGNKRDGD